MLSKSWKGKKSETIGSYHKDSPSTTIPFYPSWITRPIGQWSAVPYCISSWLNWLAHPIDSGQILSTSTSWSCSASADANLIDKEVIRNNPFWYVWGKDDLGMYPCQGNEALNKLHAVFQFGPTGDLIGDPFGHHPKSIIHNHHIGGSCFVVSIEVEFSSLSCCGWVLWWVVVVSGECCGGWWWWWVVGWYLNFSEELKVEDGKLPSEFDFPYMWYLQRWRKQIFGYLRIWCRFAELMLYHRLAHSCLFLFNEEGKETNKLSNVMWVWMGWCTCCSSRRIWLDIPLTSTFFAKVSRHLRSVTSFIKSL